MNDKLINAVSELLSCLTGNAPKIPAPIPEDPIYSVKRDEEEHLIEREALKVEHLSEAEPLPRFSVVILCEDPFSPSAAETAASVKAQHYNDAEVFTLDKTKAQLSHMPPDYETPSAEKNELSGDLVLIINEGTLMKPYALSFCACRWIESDRPELMYADSEVAAEGAGYAAPFAKPAVSPENILCGSAFADMLFVTNKLYNSAGLNEPGSFLDLRLLSLKFYEKAKSVLHINHTLSTVNEEKPRTLCRSELDKLNSAFDTDDAVLFNGAYAGSLQYRCLIGKKHKAAIIIPAKSDLRQLQACLDAIDTLMTFVKCRLIITADDEAASGKMKDFLIALKRNKAAEVLYKKGVHSRPALLNIGSKNTNADTLIFVAPEVIVNTPDFVERLIEPLIMSGTAVCGGKLKYQNGSLYHTGTVIGLKGWTGSLYRGEPDDKDDELKCFYTAQQRTVSAVDGGFMAVKADAFRRAGGFDETLKTLAWDTALCLKLKERGLRCVYTPYSEAYITCVPPYYEALDKDDMQRYYDVLRDVLLKGDEYYSTRYDYASVIPRFAAEPKPPIELNPLYN